MAGRLTRGLGKLTKGIGYTLAALVVATVISGLLVGPLGAAGAGWVFLGLFGYGSYKAVQAARGKTKAQQARTHRGDVASYADEESQFAEDYANHLRQRYADPSERQTFYEEQLGLQAKSGESAEKQRKRQKEELDRQRAKQKKAQGGERSDSDDGRRSGYDGGGLSDRFQSAAGTGGGGQSAYDASRQADLARQRADQELKDKQDMIRMMTPGK